jgi:hypothetical protein
MHLSHQYNAAYFSCWVKNRCTYHTNTTAITFLAWYRIDAPITPIQRRLLFWLGTESLVHRFSTKPEKKAALYWCDWCIDSLPSQKSKRRCIGVIGASILYQARKVSGVVLVC